MEKSTDRREGDLLTRMKEYFMRYFDQTFVLIILLATLGLNYVITDKVVFLNFYFLPVLLAGYVLGKNMAVLGSVLCALFVGFYVLLTPQSIKSDQDTWDLVFLLLPWGGFLILSGYIVGTLSDHLKSRVAQATELFSNVETNRRGLEQAHHQLADYSQNLEAKVRERTMELEDKNRTIEGLKSRVEAVLYSTMDPVVAKLVINRQLTNEKRRISILFSDIVAFTGYSEIYVPEVIIEQLNRYFSAMEPIITVYKGHLDKYIGDGMMAEFGIPINYENHALFAVLTGLKMQERLKESDFPWKTRIGISSGNAICGLIGSERRQSFTVLGDVVNLAARLESISPPDKVCIDEQTYEHVKPYVTARKLRRVAPELEEGRIQELESLIEEWEQALKATPDDAAVICKMGQAYLELGGVSEALTCFKSALRLHPPEEEQIQRLLAQAVMQEEEMQRISVKGKQQAVVAYELIGLKDPLEDPRRFPESLRACYRDVETLVSGFENALLSVEGLDGTIGHGKVTGVLSYAAAGILGIDEKGKRDAFLAGYLHDVGKQIVPEQILNHPGEFGVLRAAHLRSVSDHPLAGVKILLDHGYGVSKEVLDGVHYHHEWYSGGGYPGEKVGEDIPLIARIVAVADEYDALTSPRSYREPWERQAALNEIQRDMQRGKFDPQVVDAVLRIMQSPV